MSDLPTAYESDTLAIYEWPQPMCEIHDKATNGWVQVREPADIHASIKSLESALIVFKEQVIKSSSSPGRTSEDDVMVRCQELLVDYNNIHERAEHQETISATLAIVQEAFILTPKVVALPSGTLVEIPVNSSHYSVDLSELWDNVAS